MSLRSEPLPFDDLPGGDLVRQGLTDIGVGVESVPALLVRIAAPRLQGLALDVPDYEATGALPEHRLYELLAAEHGDNAHSRYNALIRLLVSFARAAECVR